MTIGVAAFWIVASFAGIRSPASAIAHPAAQSPHTSAETTSLRERRV
jgi:hypothetical protein